LFDPERGVAAHDGSDPISIRARIDGLQLLKELLCNGSLEVYSAGSGTLLGRTDPYIGHNIDLAKSVANIDLSIEQLRTRLREADTETTPSN
jgi:hypothetical protein